MKYLMKRYNIAIETLKEIANDGCGLWQSPDHTCCDIDDKGEWCWSCIAAAALERIEAIRRADDE